MLFPPLIHELNGLERLARTHLRPDCTGLLAEDLLDVRLLPVVQL